MNFQLSGRIQPPQDSELLHDLRRVSALINTGSLTSRQYQPLGRFSIGLFYIRFGSWPKAVIAAGLNEAPKGGLSAEALLDNLHALWLALGHQPTTLDLCPPLSKYSIRPYRRVFGNWRNALVKMVEKFSDAATRSTPQQDHPHQAADLFVINERAQPHDSRNIKWRIRHLVMKRDHFKCTACGASPATNPGTELHVDHIIPVSKGGTSVIENLQTLCRICNLGKGDL